MDHKRRVKPFKQALHTLYPRHREHPVVQLPISVTSSVPEMSAARSPRGLVLLPSLATQDATSAFNVPLRPQEGRKLRNRTETGILGQGTLLSCLTTADLCVTLSPRAVLTLIFSKYVWVRFLFSALFVSSLNHSSFTCRPRHSSPLVFDGSALTKLEAIESVTGEAALTKSGGADPSRISSMEKLPLAHSALKIQTELDVQGDVTGANVCGKFEGGLQERTSITSTLFRDSDADLYFCL